MKLIRAIRSEHGLFRWRYWLARMMYPNPLKTQSPEDKEMVESLRARTEQRYTPRMSEFELALREKAEDYEMWKRMTKTPQPIRDTPTEYTPGAATSFRR